MICYMVCYMGSMGLYRSRNEIIILDLSTTGCLLDLNIDRENTFSVSIWR